MILPFSFLHRNLARTIAAMMVLIIHHAELAGSHAMDSLLRMNHPSAIFEFFDSSRMILRRMANLERYLLHRHLTGEEMEILQWEILLVRRLRVVAVTHVENILLHILLDYEPRSAAEAQTLALADGVEPQTLVASDALARLHLNHVARVLAQVSADVIVIVDLSQEANSLTILALGINEMFLFCYLTNFILDVMTDRENRFS